MNRRIVGLGMMMVSLFLLLQLFMELDLIVVLGVGIVMAVLGAGMMFRQTEAKNR